VGAPMLIGPLLGAALLVVIWALTREMVLAGQASRDDAESIARVAVGLSLVSVAMRLYTADALPYGATAVAVTAAFAAALRGRRLGDRRYFGLAGLAVGGVVATQPLSAIAVFAVVMALAFGSRDRRALLAVVLACIPGVLLLLAANRAALGHAFASPVAAYHSLFEASVTPKHRRAVALLLALRSHLADVVNLEPLALLALVPLLGKGRSRTAALAGLVVGGQMLVAAITSAVPVAGAAERALVCVVPVEQVLVAIALARLASRVSVALPRVALGAIALSIVGFAVHAVYDHQRMAASDLGRPHYEPDVVRDATVAHGLLYFDDDQGFELAFDPEVPASHGIQAVRMRGDDHDRLLYDLLGHPQIHRYSATAEAATVTAWTPPNAGSDSWRFEAESDWPAARAGGAHVEISEGGPPCASDGKGLTVTPLAPAAGASVGMVTLSLPVPRGALPPERKNWVVVPRVILRGGVGSATLVLVSEFDGPPLAKWAWDDAAKAPMCLDLPPQTVELGGDRPRAWLVLTASAGAVTLDKTTLKSR
jgi:hypothetical protein